MKCIDIETQEFTMSEQRQQACSRMGADGSHLKLQAAKRTN